MQFREIVLNLGRKKGRRVVIPRPEDKGGRWGVGGGDSKENMNGFCCRRSKGPQEERREETSIGLL